MNRLQSVVSAILSPSSEHWLLEHCACTTWGIYQVTHHGGDPVLQWFICQKVDLCEVDWSVSPKCTRNLTSIKQQYMLCNFLNEQGKHNSYKQDNSIYIIGHKINFPNINNEKRRTYFKGDVMYKLFSLIWKRMSSLYRTNQINLFQNENSSVKYDNGRILWIIEIYWMCGCREVALCARSGKNWQINYHTAKY